MNFKALQLCSSAIAAAFPVAAPALAQAQTSPAPAAQPSAPAQPAPDKSSEVVVTGQRSDVVSSPDRLSFNVANDLQAQTGTVADALRAVPGVEVDLQGGVSLRGDPGVTILIDGRPSAMLRGEGRGDVLLSMPAGQIERVEVITNPSAAFSPEGSGGVINLVSKQVRPGARSATIRATLGDNGSGGLNLNGAVSRPGLTMSGDLGYRRFKNTGSALQERSRLDMVSGAFVDSRLEAKVENAASSRNARFAVDYDVDKKNRLSTELSFRDNRIHAQRTDSFSSPTSAYGRTSDVRMMNRGYGLTASWRRTLPGSDHELVADIELEAGQLRREVEGVTTPSLPAGPAGYERIRNAADRGDYGVKLDYKRPMADGQSLNIGYELDVGRTDFEYSGGRGLSFDTLLPVAALTNRFGFDQDVHALYGTFKFELGKLELQPGLRAEQVELGIDQVSNGISVSQDYFRVYPTLHLGYALSNKQRLRASYSRRIQRPGPQDLNPYTLYIDPQNVRRGNPSLRPEVTDSLELSWQLRDGGTFYSVTGFYRDSRGGVTDVVQDLGGGIFLSTRANLATTRRVGAELVANGKLSKTLSYNASGTFQWNEIDPRQLGISAPRSGTTGTVRANVTWQPTSNDFFQLNGFYSGEQLLPQGYRSSSGIVNLGYRRKVSERFSLVLTAQNILDSARQVLVIDTPTIRDRVTQRGGGRLFLLSLSYNLGNPGGRRRQEPGFDFDPGASAQ